MGEGVVVVVPALTEKVRAAPRVVARLVALGLAGTCPQRWVAVFTKPGEVVRRSPGRKGIAPRAQGPAAGAA